MQKFSLSVMFHFRTENVSIGQSCDIVSSFDWVRGIFYTIFFLKSYYLMSLFGNLLRESSCLSFSLLDTK